MKQFLLFATGLVFMLVLMFTLWPSERANPVPPIVQKSATKELEAKVERLESMVQRLSLNVEQMQVDLKDATVKYDYEDGFSILRFYQLKPFAGKLMACEISPPAGSFDAQSDGPTCRLTIERKSDGKTIEIESFKA